MIDSSMKLTLYTLLILSLLTTFNRARGESIADRIAKAEKLDQRWNQPLFRSSVELEWLDDNDRLAWYRVQVSKSEYEYYVVDLERRLKEPIFDRDELLKQLNCELASNHSSLPELTKLSLSSDAKLFEFSAFDADWSWNRQETKLAKIEGSNHLATQSGLIPLKRWRNSRNSGDHSGITFDNRLNYPVRIYWINTEGNKSPYGEVAANSQREQHTFAGHVWLVEDTQNNPLALFRAEAHSDVAVLNDALPKPPRRDERPNRAPKAREHASPDGLYRVELNEFNVRVVNKQTDEPWQVSEDGREADGFVGPIWWSPDSKRFVVFRRKIGDRRQVTLVESSPKDQLQPKLHTFDYAKPGDKLDQFQPYLVDIESRIAKPASTELFANQFELQGLGWSPDGNEFRFQYNQRGHQLFRVLALNTNSNIRTIIEEKPETFFCYSHKYFLEFLEDQQQAIWMSERDGYNHLYLYDLKSGNITKQLTKGNWVVRSVERVDHEKQEVWLVVSGIDPTEDPYHRHLVRVNLQTSELTRLTHGTGDHEWSFSPTGRWLIDRYSRMDQPMIVELIDAQSGERVLRLEQADDSALRDKGWKPAEPFVAKGRDRQTDIFGIIVRPSDFDPSKKYPVLEYIYAGPQDAFVPKEFGRKYLLEKFAELGFIVVQIDGMGTSNRSKAFHDVCWKNLGDSGFPDRMAWLKAAAQRYPQFDLSQGVGVWGGSAGGQSALRALLAHGDFYSAAAADCGCHDNRMDKIWWNEQWMGWPIDSHYEEQSNVTNAHKLEGNLLLTVGELDRNVDPASTMQVAAALIAAKKDFQLIVFPSAGHGIGSSQYGEKQTMKFFLQSFGL